ncbi:MAG: hypothetical protein IPP77_08195 [Bacteroidetes bacterium]|nr:hypothetical protein [Bacteroidota bacterium]
MAKDIIPGKDGDLKNWLEVFKVGIGQLGVNVGLSNAQIIAAQDLCLEFSQQITIAHQAKVAAKKENAKKKSMRTTHLQPLRKLMKRVKISGDYNPSMGKQMGIIATRPVFQPHEYKPVLKVGASGQLIKISFKKKGVERLEFYGMKNGSEAWQFIGTRSHSPFYFKPPDELTGSGEKWIIKAVGIIKDKPIGQYSDLVTVMYLHN